MIDGSSVNDTTRLAKTVIETDFKYEAWRTSISARYILYIGVSTNIRHFDLESEIVDENGMAAIQS